MTQRIIRFPEVSNRTGYKHTTIYDKIARGEFPKPVSLGARAVGWLEKEIDEWIEARVKLSRTANGGNHAAA